MIAEINFERTLFEDNHVFDDIYCMMRELGFCFKGVVEQHLSKVDGRIMFADAVFERVVTLVRYHALLGPRATRKSLRNLISVNFRGIS